MSNSNGSQYFVVQGSGDIEYRVTVNYLTGHFCTCRGMLSLKRTWQADAGKTIGTSCKHIKNIIRKDFGNDWGTKNPDGSRTPANPPVSTPSKPTGRRAAIEATRAKLEARVVANVVEEVSLVERIAGLQRAKTAT